MPTRQVKQCSRAELTRRHEQSLAHFNTDIRRGDQRSIVNLRRHITLAGNAAKLCTLLNVTSRELAQRLKLSDETYRLLLDAPGKGGGRAPNRFKLCDHPTTFDKKEARDEIDAPVIAMYKTLAVGRLTRLEGPTVAGAAPYAPDWEDLDEIDKFGYRVAARVVIETIAAQMRSAYERLETETDETDETETEAEDSAPESHGGVYSYGLPAPAPELSSPAEQGLEEPASAVPATWNDYAAERQRTRDAGPESVHTQPEIADDQFFDALEPETGKVSGWNNDDIEEGDY